ncbi:peptidoglycan editing factor PgeF [bacterium]|nr:peptidoglycan editing factor PgeF [bacterium]
MFYFDEIAGKCILRSDLVEDLNCFFTTREIVIKSGEQNFEKIVNANKKLLYDYLKVEELISPVQTHSANIDFAIEGRFDYSDTDALILTNKKQAIFLNFADCVPVILYDKKRHIAAVSHAGWRGTVQKIAPKTVQIMQSNPKDIIAVIGPAISLCCYNVGQGVFEQLEYTVKNFENLYEFKNNEIYVDLKGINAQQLKEIGVENIDLCPYCTCCNNDKFFSYRKENGTTNRHSAVIRL